MKSIISDYKKYRWFFTSNDVLVVGGKSSEQNDVLLNHIKSSNKELIVMHTHSPGSPFSVILEDIDKVKKSDLEETAVFTACFSKDWKKNLKTSKIDIFLSTKIFKSKLMAQGTWGVKDKLDSINVPLKLVLAKQKGVLRAIPPQTAKSKNNIYLYPGKIEKTDLIMKINLELDEDLQENEILSALPSGGIRISNN